jgi:hypothetical protein
MPPVKCLRINAVHMAHQPRQVCLPRVQHQVVVVAHLAVGQHLRVKPVHRMGDGFKLRLSIPVVAVDRFAPIATRRDVINRVGEFDAQGAGHGPDASSKEK